MVTTLVALVMNAVSGMLFAGRFRSKSTKPKRKTVLSHEAKRVSVQDRVQKDMMIAEQSTVQSVQVQHPLIQELEALAYLQDANFSVRPAMTRCLLERLDERIDQSPNITVLWAPRSTGKTTCALQAAHDWRNQAQQARHFFYHNFQNFQNFQDFQDVERNMQASIEEVVASYLPSSTTSTNLCHQLRQFNKQLLVVLDNFDAQNLDKLTCLDFKALGNDMEAADVQTNSTKHLHIILVVSKPAAAQRLCSILGGACKVLFSPNKQASNNHDRLSQSLKWSLSDAKCLLAQHATSNWTHSDSQQFAEVASMCSMPKQLCQLIRDHEHFKNRLDDQTTARMVRESELVWNEGTHLLLHCLHHHPKRQIVNASSTTA